MSVKYFFNDTEGFLKVIASGLCDDIGQFKKCVLSIEKTLISTGHKKLLIDETLLEYRFSTIEIYTSVCFVSQLARRPH